MYSNHTHGQTAGSGLEDLVFLTRAINIATISQICGVTGVITNIINMIVFVRIGFRESTVNVSLFALAIVDFGISVTTILMAVGLNPLFIDLDIPVATVPVVYLLIVFPRHVFTKITTAITAFITFERCLCVAMPLKVKSIITTTRVKICVSLIYVIIITTSLPEYAAQFFGWVYYPQYNVTIFSVVFSDMREEIEAWFLPVYTFTYSVVVFLCIVIFTIILVVSLSRKSKWRQSATTATPASGEVSTKEKKIAKMIVVISSIFIVLYSPGTVLILWMAFDQTLSILGANAHLFFIYTSFSALCEIINSTINIVIYYNNSSNYKSEFNKLFSIGEKQAKK